MRTILLVLLLLTSCVSVQVEQTLHRRGTFDIELLIPQVPSFELSDRWHIESKGNETFLSVTEVHPSEVAVLFAFFPLSGNVIQFSRSTSFPNYIFTYTLSDLPVSGTLILHTFGTITETNGEILDAKTVRFDLGNGSHTVVFRDPILYTLFAQRSIQVIIGVLFSAVIIWYVTKRWLRSTQKKK